VGKARFLFVCLPSANLFKITIAVGVNEKLKLFVSIIFTVVGEVKGTGLFTVAHVQVPPLVA